ncbi:MAG: OmpH family outer membrane protein [Planctomycetota bacterium]|nr:OmpH family outer membrane protein [Planctomycetota bacterium]
MKKAERVFVYAGLAAALIGAYGLSGKTEVPAAIATPVPQAEMRVASVDVLTIVDALMMSERYRPAREAKGQESQKQMQQMLDTIKFQELEQKIVALAPGSPERNVLEADYTNKQRQAQQLNQQLTEGVAKQFTDQLAECYRLVVETVDKLARDRGYSHVLASRGRDQPLRFDNPTTAVQEILARPLIRGLAADDLTGAVMADLKVSPVATPAAAPTPTPAAEATPTPTPAPAPAPGTPK